MRNRAVLPAFLVAGMLLAIPAAQASEGAEPVGLRWALGAVEPEAVAPSAIKQDTRLESGSRLKFLVEPLTPSSVYLLLLDSDEQLHVLYRGAPQPSETEAGPSYIPAGKQWFEIDGSGEETFFLLASAAPLASLDALLDRYAADSESEVAAEVIGEIRRLHREHRKLARVVERPTLIGGRTRGTDDGSIDQLAVEITAETFYGKTITIEH